MAKRGEKVAEMIYCSVSISPSTLTHRVAASHRDKRKQAGCPPDRPGDNLASVRVNKEAALLRRRARG